MMKLLILLTTYNTVENQIYYNWQEIGLGKALSNIGNKVDIYITVGESTETEKQLNKNLSIFYKPCVFLGNNGLIDLEKLNTDYDAAIHFADTQLSVPRIYSWCRRNDIKYTPYIGCVESTSANAFIRIAINLHYRRNKGIYRKCLCLAKNATIADTLRKQGTRRIALAPVGLDIDLLKQNFESFDRKSLRVKWGYSEDDKVILFIGRLESEKRPLDMLRLFVQLHSMDSSYRLLIVGSGKLLSTITQHIETNNLSELVQHIERIANVDIWELHKISDCFVNLRTTEIFGMAILEAMYYRTTVVAFKSPCACTIIDDGLDGYLVDSDEEFLASVLAPINLNMKEAAHQKIVDNFTWEKTANLIADYLAEKIG